MILQKNEGIIHLGTDKHNFFTILFFNYFVVLTTDILEHLEDRVAYYMDLESKNHNAFVEHTKLELEEIIEWIIDQDK